MGSDAGGYGYGQNLMELELMVEAGMSPAQAIEATRRAAECLGLEDEVGTLEPGKQADLLVLDGDPLEDIGTVRRLDRLLPVMQDGVPVAGPMREGVLRGPGRATATAY